MASADRPQRLLKAELIVASLSERGLDAMALGGSDWALGSELVRGWVEEYKLPVLAANLVCGDKKPYPSSLIVERGGKRIGFVGVTEGEVDGCTVESGVASAQEALSALGDVDVRIGLIPTRKRSIEDWAEVGFDLVITAAGSSAERPKREGTAWVLQAGSRGKHLGVAELEWVPGGEGWQVEGADIAFEEEIERLEKQIARNDKLGEGAADDRQRARYATRAEGYRTQIEEARARQAAFKSTSAGATHRLGLRSVPLSRDVADHAGTQRRVEEAVKAMAALETSNVPVGPDALRKTPAGSAYAGAETCKQCHPAQYSQWEKTRHAHAYASLISDGRAMDRDCFSCHVTGVSTPDGPKGPADVGPLRDVQCEACHAPSASHVASPATALPVRNPPEEVCRTCHDGVRDEGRFDFGAYRLRIEH